MKLKFGPSWTLGVVGFVAHDTARDTSDGRVSTCCPAVAGLACMVFGEVGSPAYSARGRSVSGAKSDVVSVMETLSTLCRGGRGDIWGYFTHPVEDWEGSNSQGLEGIT